MEMSIRKSTRVSARNEMVQATKSTADSGTAPSEKSQQQARKKQKTRTSRGDTKGKGRAESQYCLTRMPLDILLGIFILLKPIDLLHLLRVSKSFHDFLWLETSAYVWRVAFDNLNLQPPPCPLDLNIIHYTNFLFGIDCQFCASRPSQMSHDALFVRSCLKCVNKCLVGPRHKVDESIRKLCHPIRINVGEVHCLKVEYDLRQKEVIQATKEETLSKYVEERQNVLERRSLQTSNIEAWRAQLAQHAAMELATIRAQRRQYILNRVFMEVPQPLAWELYNINFPHADEAHELTDVEWTHIRADIIEHLFDYCENQRKLLIKGTLIDTVRALEAVLNSFVVARPRIVPTAFHVASCAPFYSMMMKYGETPVSTVLSHVAHLPALIADWRENTDQYLAGLIPNGSRNTNSLALAKCFFRCDMCTEPISYPRILMHHCFLRPSGVNHKKRIKRKGKDENVGPREPRAFRVIDANTVFPSLSETFAEGMHENRAGVAFHTVASNLARRIIMGSRENPDTITYLEMDQKDLRVECLLCSSRRSRLVMRWTIAILHNLENHGDTLKKSFRTHWRLIESDEDMRRIKELETQKGSFTTSLLYCCLCNGEVTEDVAAAHLIDDHAFSGNGMDTLRHYYRDIDSTMAVPPLAVRI